jgi:hypothetical protein
LVATQDETVPADLIRPWRSAQRRKLWRLCRWSACAVIAILGAAASTQTEKGAQRLQIALANAREPDRLLAQIQIPTITIGADPETKRLASFVRELRIDRDRLDSRLAGLERNLDDTTGSIKRQVAEVTAAQSAAKEAPTSSSPVVAPPVAQVVMPPPQAEAPVAQRLPEPAPEKPAAQAAAQVASLPEPKEPPPRPVQKAFGVDLGGATTIDALRAHWSAVKANYGPILRGLQPVYFTYQRAGRTEYRLILGPLANTAAAAHVCAQMATVRAFCRTATFEGERLATQ